MDAIMHLGAAIFVSSSILRVMAEIDEKRRRDYEVVWKLCIGIAAILMLLWCFHSIFHVI